MSRLRVLLLLTVLLVAALWYAWQETPRQERVARDMSVADSRVVVAKSKNDSTGFAALDFSGGDKLSFKKPKRDLFRPLYRAPVVAAKPEVKPIPTTVELAPPPPPPPPPPRPVVQPAVGPKPIQPLTVLGFLQKGPQTTVFLASRQGEIFLVKKGDRFADGLLLRELAGEKVVISRGMDDPGVTLTVAEHKTQRMAIQKGPSGRPSVPDFEAPAPNPNPPQVGGGDN